MLSLSNFGRCDDGCSGKLHRKLAICAVVAYVHIEKLPYKVGGLGLEPKTFKKEEPTQPEGRNGTGKYYDSA